MSQVALSLTHTYTNTLNTARVAWYGSAEDPSP